MLYFASTYIVIQTVREGVRTEVGNKDAWQKKPDKSLKRTTIHALTYRRAAISHPEIHNGRKT